MIFLWFTIFVFILYSFLILGYRRAWGKARPFTVAAEYQPRTGITVIIPARNESGRIGKCVDSILAQQYPAEMFECIVVDDFSTDGTAAEVLGRQDGRLQLIRMAALPGMQEGHSSKKKAIAAGVDRAKHAIVVTTDADCICPPRWLRTLSAWYEQGHPSFFAAPVRFTTSQGFLQVFQALDFMSLQGITVAAASQGLHAMSNGANLGYEKTAFHAMGGFSGVDHIASGDDMLLQQKFLSLDASRVSYCFSSDAIVDTAPADSWSAFLRQRIRWASKARHYQGRVLLLVLLLVYVFNLSLLVLPFLAFTNLFFLWAWLGLLGAKGMVELAFMIPVAAFFGRSQLLAWFLPMQPLHVLYTVVAGTFGQFRTYEWKGRRVK